MKNPYGGLKYRFLKSRDNVRRLYDGYKTDPVLMMHGITKDTKNTTNPTNIAAKAVFTLLANEYLGGACEIQTSILEEYFVGNMLSVVAVRCDPG